MRKAAVLIKDISKQYEGLRTSLGLLLEDFDVHMYVLNHEVSQMDEAYSDNLGFIKEMGGSFYSNNVANAEKYNFIYVSNEEIARHLDTADYIIPF